MYVAKHYVRVDGVVYVKGEIIEKDLPLETEKRLLRLNAIEKINPHPINTPAPARDDAPAATPDDVPAATPDDVPDETPEDDVPKIDITSGIVIEPKQAEKPKKKASKKK